MASRSTRSDRASRRLLARRLLLINLQDIPGRLKRSDIRRPGSRLKLGTGDVGRVLPMAIIVFAAIASYAHARTLP